MARFDLADRLQLIAGNLEPFMATGGVVTATETRWLVQQLQLCADRAREIEFDLSWANRQLDEIVEDAGELARASAPPRAPRRPRLRVIAGGRA